MTISELSNIISGHKDCQSEDFIVVLDRDSFIDCFTNYIGVGRPSNYGHSEMVLHTNSGTYRITLGMKTFVGLKKELLWRQEMKEIVDAI